MPTPANSMNISSEGVPYFDGGHTFTAASPGTAGFVLTSNGAATTPSFQIPPINGTLTYYLTNTASSVASNLQLTPAPFTPKTTISFLAVTNAQNLQDWITNAGVPNLTFIPAGTFLLHIHALQVTTAGHKTSQLFAEFWEASSTGVDIAKIGTTETSVVLTTSEVEYNLAFVTSNVYTMGSAASRIKIKLFVTVAGAGTAPDVNVFVGGTADSHISLPSQTVDATNFVPYTGATADVNLGTHGITANSATLTTPLAIADGGTNASTMANTDGVVYYDGTRLVTTAVGTANQVLTSNGAGNAPTFQTAAVTQGNSVLLSTDSPTGATSVVNSWTTGFLYYYFEFIEVIPTTNATRLQIAFSTNGGLSYTNVTWDNGGFDAPSSGGGAFASNAGASATPDLLLGAVQSNTSDEGVNGWLYLWGLDSSVFRKTMHQYITHPISTTAMDFRNLGYHVRLTTQVTGLRLSYSGAGGFASGTINFYGVKS